MDYFKNRVRHTIGGILAFGIGLLLFQSQSVMGQQVRFQNGILYVELPRQIVTGPLERALEANVAGYVKNSDTQTAYIDGFRVGFDRGGMKLKFDYQAKRRAMTHNPFGGNLYSSWVKDSGWIEARVSINVRNGRLQAWTRNGHVRWGSNNWFTNKFLTDYVGPVIRDETSEAINDAIIGLFGGNSVSLSEVVTRHAVPVLQRELNMPANRARQLLASAFQNVNTNATLDERGIRFSIDLVPRRGVVTLRNSSRNKITYKIRFNKNSNWLNETLAPGGTRWHWSRHMTHPEIEFDGTSNVGYQPKRYRLEANWTKKIADPVATDGTSYTFHWDHQVLDLKKR